MHNFADPALGEHAKAIPYRVYDLANNNALDQRRRCRHTAKFEVNPIRTGCDQSGPGTVPLAAVEEPYSK